MYFVNYASQTKNLLYEPESINDVLFLIKMTTLLLESHTINHTGKKKAKVKLFLDSP